ncbi:DUF4252 domain-containing protein [Nibricoccus sp. IMCC34717]|uniref:DUF4252 domain-containing protein n=1 Tax=Nibricoccus sp. IMCC34717 TaxID=3034021 RepID=UPI00384F160E
MKKLTLVVLLATASAVFAAETKLSPMVSVDLGPALLGFVGTCAKAKDGEAADVIKTLKSVRVKVYEFDGTETSMAEIQKQVRAQSSVTLDSAWSQIVSVNKPGEALVDIHVRMKNAEEVGGVVAAIASHDKKGVLIEIEGDIRADQVEKLVRRIPSQGLPGLAPVTPPAPSTPATSSPASA